MPRNEQARPPCAVSSVVEIAQDHLRYEPARRRFEKEEVMDVLSGVVPKPHPRIARLLAGLVALLGGLLGPSLGSEAGPETRASSTTRVYVLRGLGDRLTSSAMDDLAVRISQRSARAAVWTANWHEWRSLVADAISHPGDRIVFVGFSMGAASAGLAANELAAAAIPSTVIAVDPMCADASVMPTPLVKAVNFYANLCGSNGLMAGATNVRVSTDDFGPLDHLSFPTNPHVQGLILDRVFGAEPVDRIGKR